MAYIFENPNPCNNRVGDCVIRAISLAMDRPWKEVYTDLAVYGYMLCDMPSSNAVWGLYLKDKGFVRGLINDTCPDGCYTVRDFCSDFPKGTFILGTGTHVICVKNGSYLDSWDSGDEVPVYYWRR